MKIVRQHSVLHCSEPGVPVIPHRCQTNAYIQLHRPSKFAVEKDEYLKVLRKCSFFQFQARRKINIKYIFKSPISWLDNWMYRRLLSLIVCCQMFNVLREDVSFIYIFKSLSWHLKLEYTQLSCLLSNPWSSSLLDVTPSSPTGSSVDGRGSPDSHVAYPQNPDIDEHQTSWKHQRRKHRLG